MISILQSTCSRLSVLLLLVLASALVLSACTIVAQPEVPSPTPPVVLERRPVIEVTPLVVEADTLVTVVGFDWPAGADVFVNLESPGQPALTGTFAVARVSSEGKFNISFFFPDDPRWRTVPSPLLVARALMSDQEVAVSLATAEEELDLDPTPVVTPTPVATDVPVSTAGRARVTGERVNVRQGPSTEYPVLLVVKENMTLTVTGQNSGGDWLRVLLPAGGGEGWIARALTDFTATAPTVAAPPLARATPAPVITGWRGEYFNNRTLEGTPVLVRDDANVKFDWDFTSPAANVPADGFSARWTRSLSFAGGAYIFHVRMDDGVRVWLDNELLIDLWRDQSVKTHEVRREVTAGTHTVRIEYYENSERAEIDFWWERVNDFSHEPGETFVNWRGEYYANRSLAGQPVTVRDDSSINFVWREGTPAPSVPNDDFSVRWTRSLHFATGLYRFRAQMDDGLRLYVDGVLVIDQWLDGGVREIVVDRFLNEGIHTLRVEYYERTGEAIAVLWWERIEPGNPYPDWKGEYWANESLSGSPALVRNDSVVNFDWKQSSPGSGIPADRFSARWTRRAQFDSAVYRFYVTVDDGVRLWVDDRLLVDDWRERSSREIVADYAMASGWHDLRVEYFEHLGDARIQIRWEKVQQPTNFPDWKGEYYANQDLRGNPILVRNDGDIDFDWGTSGPAPEVGHDRFSVRWTRTVQFRTGSYRFYARVDDGIRAYVGDLKVLDQWKDNDGGDVYIAEIEIDGTERVIVEYYENIGGARVEFWWQQVK